MNAQDELIFYRELRIDMANAEAKLNLFYSDTLQRYMNIEHKLDEKISKLEKQLGERE